MRKFAYEVEPPGLSRDAEPKRPLLLFLHGIGECKGETRKQVRKHGPWAGELRNVAAPELTEFLVVAPHLNEDPCDWFGAELREFVHELMGKLPIDPSRLYLTGVSRGGRGALRLALELAAGSGSADQPNQGELQLRALAVFCPEADGTVLSNIGALRDVPLWLLHCSDDSIVPFKSSTALEASLKTKGGKVWLSDTPGQGERRHNCWSQAYARPEFYQWLKNPERRPPTLL